MLEEADIYRIKNLKKIKSGDTVVMSTNDHEAAQTLAYALKCTVIITPLEGCGDVHVVRAPRFSFSNVLMTLLIAFAVVLFHAIATR